MQYGGQIIGQPLQMQQQMSRGNSTMPLHPVQAANRNLLQQQQHGLGPNMGAGGLSGSPLTNGLQVCSACLPCKAGLRSIASGLHC